MNHSNAIDKLFDDLGWEPKYGGAGVIQAKQALYEAVVAVVTDLDPDVIHDKCDHKQDLEWHKGWRDCTYDAVAELRELFGISKEGDSNAK